MLIIDRIIELLRERKLSNKDLCDNIGVGQSTFTNWKNRKTNPPSEYIKPIADFFDVPVEFILTGEFSENNINEHQIILINKSNLLSEKDLKRLIAIADVFIES